MTIYRFTYNQGGRKYIFKRTSKETARKAYNEGLTVILCPVKMKPFSMWHYDIEINKEYISCDYQSFEAVLNSFEFYNCTAETGKYTAFYIPVIETGRNCFYTGEPEKIATLKDYDKSYVEGVKEIVNSGVKY